MNGKIQFKVSFSAKESRSRVIEGAFDPFDCLAGGRPSGTLWSKMRFFANCHGIRKVGD
jgi:hypothetical protein